MCLEKKVSVIMPVYNAENFILNTLISLENQTYQNLEILICDDCSNDKSLQIIKEFILIHPNMNIKLFKNNENLGYLKTSNFLKDKVTGDYLTFQDADDLSDPERIKKLVFFLEEKSLDVVGSAINIMSDKGKIVSSIQYPIENENIYKSFKVNPHPPFCGSAVLTKIRIIQEHGLFDESFNRIGAEDYDWLYRLALMGYKMGNLSDKLYCYRQHSQGVSKINFHNNILSLYSAAIAKDLFVARLSDVTTKDFDWFKEKYLRQHAMNPEKYFYITLSNSFFLSRKEIAQAFTTFYTNTLWSKNKLKYCALAVGALILGKDNFEKIKNPIRKMNFL
nr:glycosyltransferase family 2 protein [Moraxella osloensis]